ncbi:MAG: FliI/YscN family ATPase [Gammaproteobacteria bacterium]|nr:FliI/YscN family ATPase [Gammaproteobacteria bacterium]
MSVSYLEAIESSEFTRRVGRVTQFLGLVIEADGPDACLGEKCEIISRSQVNSVLAEVVGIKQGRVLLMPYGEIRGISTGSEVVASGKKFEVPVGDALLGRVIDAFGQPLDGGAAPATVADYPIYNGPLNPMERPRISSILETGVACIDTLLTIGKGQRVGIFAGSGVGKSTLLGMIARNMRADINVIALVGERGREVLDFVEQNLGAGGLKRSVVVVATSDQPPLVRAHAALAATAIAEYFRDNGHDVLLTMDSLTRFAMAQREVGLAIGEPPTARGYTPSVFSRLPRLLERGGTAPSGGSITAFYTILVEGDDLNDPISDNVRAILDGSIVLSRDLASEHYYPPVDVLQSNSRLLPMLVDEAAMEMVGKTLRTLGTYERSRDMVDIGAYRAGSNPELDVALALMPKIREFVHQGFGAVLRRDKALEALQQIFGEQGARV